MKAYPRSARLFALAILVAIAAAGCDSYSLLEEFSLPYRIAEGGPVEPLNLSIQGSDAAIRLTGSVSLVPEGGVKPYSYEVSGEDLYGKTSALTRGSVSNNVYSAGGAIGRIRITLTDAYMSTAFAYATVLPPAPTMTVERVGGDTNAEIDWFYSDIGIIDYFFIECRAEGDAGFSSCHTATDVGSYTDQNLIPGLSYTYRITAVSGSYASPSIEITI